MGWWQVDADTLAQSRFALSELAEAAAALLALHRNTAAHPAERAWLDTSLPAYRERLAGDPITAALVGAAVQKTWIADFVTPAPAADEEWTFDQEVKRVRTARAEDTWADLEVALGGSLPDELHRSDLGARAADLLEWVWVHTVAPHWPQRRRVLEADVIARTRQLSLGGWAAALDDLRPQMRWLGGGRLQINAYDYPPQDVSGSQLLFVPVTSSHGWAVWDRPDRFALVYPCSGLLAEQSTPPPAALARLLGSGRAQVLLLLGTPKSTSQLVVLTGQGLGSVGRHLKVLLDARLVLRRRAGRSVLYSRTTTGEALVRAQDDT